MGGTDFQPGKAIERAFEDQVRECDRGLQRIADRVGEKTVATQPAARLQLARAGGMHEDEDAQLLALLPERVELGIGEFLASHAAAHTDAAEAELLHGMFDLLCSKVGVLQGGRRIGNETFGIGSTELDQRLVLDPDQLRRGVATGAIPEGIDAESLDIDALAVHRGDARAGVIHQQARRLERMIDHRHRLWHAAMGVHVDGLDPLAVDHDLTPPRLGVCMGMSVSGRSRT